MNSQTLRSSIAAGASAVLGLSLAVAIGVVPRAGGDDGNVQLISAHGVGADVPFRPLFESTQPTVQAAHPATRHADAPQSSAGRTTTVTTAVRRTTATTSTDSVTGQDNAASAQAGPQAHFVSATSTDKKKHAKKKAHHKKAKKHAAPKLAPRTHPTKSAVSSAIAGLKKYVHTPFSVTASEVAEFGDDVCSAFDSNQTFAHIKAEILAKVKQIPFTTVESGAADYVVKTAVKLYCPAYGSRAR